MVHWGQLFPYTSYCTTREYIKQIVVQMFNSPHHANVYIYIHTHTHTHTQYMCDLNLLTRKISNSTMLSLHHLCNLSQHPTTNNIGNNWHNRAIWQSHIIVKLKVSPRSHPYWYWNLQGQTTKEHDPPHKAFQVFLSWYLHLWMFRHYTSKTWYHSYLNPYTILHLISQCYAYWGKDSPHTICM